MTARCRWMFWISESSHGSKNRKGRIRMSSQCLTGAGRGLALVIALALAGCSSITHSNVSNSNQPSNSNEAMETESNKSADAADADGAIDSRLVAANTAFGFKLFAEVA